MIDWILTHYLDVLAIAGGAVSVATAITALTPNKKDDAVVSKIRTVLEFISLRLGR